MDPSWQGVGHGLDGRGPNTEWSDVGSVFHTTPYGELFDMHPHFVHAYDYDLRLPNTIKFDGDPDGVEYKESDPGAIKPLSEFVEKVRKNIIRHPKDGMVGDFIDRTVDVQIEDGQLFISELQSKNN